ncbi:cytochrome c [Falsihalocynthiibacter sp. BN13B15]|uniref:c-type cytochrome n=1 Tax=Falsihalocynthiibacter sp. BN13B15 TaxID=3240871 RepID=UPI0035104195
MKTTPILASIVVGFTAIAAFAHGGAMGIVKERMDAMDAMGKAVKSVAPMMQGTTDYNAETVKQAAALFLQHSGEEMTSLFPEGSGAAPSEAKATVWSDWDEFSELAERLGVAAEGLAKAADNGLMMGGNTSKSASDMMGGGGMMGASPATNMSVAQIAAMPADQAFTIVSQVCTACHTKYRAENK